jgi:hypothetical protein
MKRREFIAGLGVVAAWPVVAHGQQSALPVIGFLNGNSPEAAAPLLAAFRQGLREERFVDGENVTIFPRWADNQYERLPALAMELVSAHVAVSEPPGCGSWGRSPRPTLRPARAAQTVRKARSPLFRSPLVSFPPNGRARQ